MKFSNSKTIQIKDEVLKKSIVSNISPKLCQLVQNKINTSLMRSNKALGIEIDFFYFLKDVTLN